MSTTTAIPLELAPPEEKTGFHLPPNPLKGMKVKMAGKPRLRDRLKELWAVTKTVVKKVGRNTRYRLNRLVQFIAAQAHRWWLYNREWVHLIVDFIKLGVAIGIYAAVFSIVWLLLFIGFLALL